MSYCRWSGDSDIYMYPHVGGYVECCGCPFSSSMKNKQFKTRSKAFAHLLEHEKAGHRVPPYAFERLRKEINEEGEKLQVRYCDNCGENLAVFVAFDSPSALCLKCSMEIIDDKSN